MWAARHPIHGTALLAAAAALLTLSGSSLAQSVQDRSIEEIVVTARKQEESLQDVPISVAAFTSQQMRDLGLRNNFDVAAFTPNFNTVKRIGRAGDRPVIRGMANPPDPNQGEANASYFIDGVFVSGTISTATANSMERVEILRGPQSAQFGRATFSGAVNYITRTPTNQFAGDINVRYGSNEERQIAGWISGPVVEDRLLFLVSASYDEYGGQWRNNLQPDSAFVNGSALNFVFDGQNTEGDRSELGDEETTEVLTKLTWTPGESTVVNLKYSYTEGDDSLYPTNVLPNTASEFPNLNCYIPDDPSEPWYESSRGEFCGSFSIEGTENRKNLPDLRNGLFADSPVGNLTDAQRTSAPADPGLERDTHRVMGEWIQDLREWTAVFRASYSEDDFSNVIDFDQQEVRAVWGLFALDIEEEIEDYSFEFSVSSPVDYWIRGKLGGYYFNREENRQDRSFTGPAPVFGVAPGAGFGDPREVDTENISVFGSVSIDLSTRWTLDMEARYAEDDKEITSGQRSIIDNSSKPVETDLDFDNFTPRFTLSWKPTDDLLAYGLVAKGNKPGDFNKDLFRSDIPAEFTEFQINCVIGDILLVPGIPPTECTAQLKQDIEVKEEEQWTYELGVKTTWFGNRVTANLAAFYIDWDNQALTEVAEVPTSSGAITAVQVQRNVGKSEVLGLELETNWLVTDNLSVFFNYGLTDGEFDEGSLPDFATTTGTDGDVSGNQIPDSPKHSVVAGFAVDGRLTQSVNGFLRGDYLYESKRYVNASNLNWVSSREIVNLRLGLESEDWTLTFYVRNLLDDDTPISALRFFNYAADPIFTSPGAPNDSTAANVYPRLYSVIPQRERDYGLELQYRFGN